MAASKWQVYHEAKKYFLNGGIDLDSAAIRMKLVKGTGAAAVSNYTRSTFASAGTAVTVSGNTTVRTPAALSVKQLNGSQTISFDSDNVVFTASGSQTSIQYAVIGVSGGYAIGWCKLTTSPVSLGAGSTLTITINASGYFTLTGGNAA